jgi:hypothetical protein
MRYVWLAVAFVGILAVGLLVGIILARSGGGEQGSAAPSPQTVTVERTVPAQTSSPRTTFSPATGSAPATTPTGSVGSLDDARAAFEQAVEGYGNPNLEVAEVMEFSNNFYAEIKEKDTGIGAMELLINRPGSRVYPEPGPNMMWNAKYGMMSGSGGYGGMMGPNGRGMMGPGGRGMMRGFSSAPPQNSRGNIADRMPVSSDRAREIADAYLSHVSPGTRAEEPTRFYGYYTIDTQKDGKTSGMLSVNGYSGEVWYHSWHGPFIAKQEED